MSNTQPRKHTVARTPTHPLGLEAGDVGHVGVDIHKGPYSVALLGNDRELISIWVQPARPEVHIEQLRPLREKITQVVYEAGPIVFSLARRLRVEGFQAQVPVTSKPLAPVGHGAKSGRLD